MINFPDNESELLACFLVSKLDTSTSSYIQPEVQALIKMVLTGSLGGLAMILVSLSRSDENLRAITCM